MSVDIRSSNDLEGWLYYKPSSWARVVAARSALRVLPFIFQYPPEPEGNDSVLVLSVMRSAAILIGARDHATYESTDSLTAANAYQALDDCRRRSWSSKVAHLLDSMRSALAAVVNDNEVAAEAGKNHALKDAVSTVGSSDKMLMHFAAQTRTNFWAEVSHDCDYLLEGNDPNQLLNVPLWRERTDQVADYWINAASTLSAGNAGFGIWREWFFGRLEGLDHAFANFDDAADQRFYRYALAKSEEWWQRNPEQVNADIQKLVDSLRQLDAPVDFFISYASENEDMAREVAQVLDDIDGSYIVQYRDFPQSNWVNAMNDAMERAERIIPLYSKDYIRSDHCNVEWNAFYERDPGSTKRRIVAFLLEPSDLKPMMRQVVYRDLSTITSQSERRAAIREWIEWEPPTPTRAWVEEVVTNTLSPQIVPSNDNTLDLAPNSDFDQPEYPADLLRALDELRMMLDLVSDDEANLPRMMKRALGRYDDELSENGANASWGGLDRLISIVADGMDAMSAVEFSPGQQKALEQLIRAHNECMSALKNADKRMRDLDAVPLDNMEQEKIAELVNRLRDFFGELSELDLTSERLDEHVEDLVQQGREFEFQAGAPNAADKPQHAMRRYLLYVGGAGLAALNAVGAMASISAAPAAQQAMALGRKLVDAFFNLVGL